MTIRFLVRCWRSYYRGARRAGWDRWAALRFAAWATARNAHQMPVSNDDAAAEAGRGCDCRRGGGDENLRPDGNGL